MTTIDETRARLSGIVEPRVYSPDTDRTGQRFLQDVVNGAMLNDKPAKERLERHQAEERDHNPHLTKRGSGVGTGAFSGLVVPAYILDQASAFPTTERPLADAMNHFDLPATGMSVNIARITSGTSVALQATELASVSFTDVAGSLLTLPVQTAAGEALVSRQAIERSTSVAQLVWQDLLAEYNATLDSTLLNQATTGLSAVAQNVDFPSASASASTLYPKMIKAAGLAKAAIKGRAPVDLAVMTSNRWYYLQEALVTAWPMYGAPGVNALPFGPRVVQDDNVTTSGTADSGTGEDEIYLGPSKEAILFESPGGPLYINADVQSSSTLGVTLVLYGEFAYTFSRVANAFAKVTGAGLSAVSL